MDRDPAALTRTARSTGTSEEAGADADFLVGAAAGLVRGPADLLNVVVPLWAGWRCRSTRRPWACSSAAELAVSVLVRPLAGAAADRDGDRKPVVTHTLRPVPALPRQAADRHVAGSASLVKVLMPIMCVLEFVHEGLLPNVQRVARPDFL